MKKFFGISLALLLTMFVLAVQTGYSTPLLVDDDVGITYVIADQIDNPVEMECATIGESAYSCTQELLRPVNRENNISISSDMYLVAYELKYKQVVTTLSTNTFDKKAYKSTIGKSFSDNVESITRLDIGESSINVLV